MTPSVLGLESRREELLAEVAILIYEQGLTQQEVAERIGVSRSTVSRLLDEARQRGIVQVYINTPFHRSVDLQSRLCERFALREARVLVSRWPRLSGDVAAAGHVGRLLLEGALLRNDMRVGVAWGTALYELVRAFRPLDRDTHIAVVQIIGSIGAIDQNVDGANLAHEFARLVRGRYYDLHAPLVVETPQLREALMRERDVAEVLAMARQADMALVGIGSVETGLLQPGARRLPERGGLAHSRAASAVGDVCAHHFDCNGVELPIDLNQRVIGHHAGAFEGDSPCGRSGRRQTEGAGHSGRVAWRLHRRADHGQRRGDRGLVVGQLLLLPIPRPPVPALAAAPRGR